MSLFKHPTTQAVREHGLDCFLGIIFDNDVKCVKKFNNFLTQSNAGIEFLTCPELVTLISLYKMQKLYKIKVSCSRYILLLN